MADITYDPLTETTALNAASVNDRFTGVTAAVNALMAESVQQMCFNENHLPSMVVEQLHQWVGASGVHNYRESVLGNGTYATINNSGDAGGGTELALTFTGSGHAIVNAGPIGGILVLVDINMQRVGVVGSGDAHSSEADFRLQVQYGGSWYTLSRTERHVDVRNISRAAALDSNQFVNVNMWTLITTADDGGSNNITGVRAQVAAQDRRQAEGGLTVGDVQVTLHQCQITALVLRSELS